MVLVSVFTRAGTHILFSIGPFDATTEGVDFAGQTLVRLFAISTSIGAKPRTRAWIVPPRATLFASTVNVARPAESVSAFNGAPIPPVMSTGSAVTGLPSESVTAATRVAVVSVPRNAM